MRFTIYGISNCSTVKRARQWFQDQGLDTEWVDFRETPVAKDKIVTWVKALGAKSLRNTSGGSYRALSPEERANWTDQQWIQAFANDPMLIRRPVIERDGEPVMTGFRGGPETIRNKLGL